MQSNNEIAIIIPVYNAEKYIEKCLDSISNQSYKKFEVIIIDDGSVDASKEIYNKFVNIDDRFKAFYQPNLGPSSARNLGIEKSNSAYITFVDADDFIEVDYLLNLIRAANKYKPDLVCAGYYDLSKFNKKPLPVNDFKPYVNTTIFINDFVLNLFKGTSGVLWAKLFKSAIIKDNNILLNPKVKMSEDLIFVLEYAFYTKRIRIINTNNYYYNRINEEGITSKQNIEFFYYLALTNKAIQSVFEKNKFRLIAIQDLKTERIWALLKLLSFNMANDNVGIFKKRKNINSILENEYVKKHLFLIKEERFFFGIHLFFLKKGLTVLDILYCNLLKKMIDIKRYLRGI
ncbi:glycosyltransferase involved in cell wall biosynthesis [Lutibacter oceani]|uniref:Glycosyltransferase involved in cell wall biosynthesis n=1 Tax=Lutibacter oceani TaxID=1853311 RepID=A0A3D9S377_9FLAO|nr:glycosyltransferase family 2 protein [Lutibacter oceani]REE83092.1 glycosyltransferase involved in cell wall biosynthesis [Lutibacter oceani]